MKKERGASVLDLNLHKQEITKVCDLNRNLLSNE